MTYGSMGCFLGDIISVITMLATLEGEITPTGLQTQDGREPGPGKPVMERVFKK
jgi:hypothetical protein